MLYGRLEAVTSSGYVEGWAYDGDAPLRPLIVSVHADGEELAQGIANLYRPSLAEACYGTGWCGFRLKFCPAISQPPQVGLSLWAKNHQIQICQTAALPLAEDDEPGLSTLDDVLSSDPTVVHSIEQLSGCNQVFENFIRSQGVDVFVRNAHVYILGRTPDRSNMAVHSALLRAGTMSPYELLRSLYETEEFSSEPRLLAAPPEAGFAFQVPCRPVK